MEQWSECCPKKPLRHSDISDVRCPYCQQINPAFYGGEITESPQAPRATQLVQHSVPIPPKPRFALYAKPQDSESEKSRQTSIAMHPPEGAKKHASNFEPLYNVVLHTIFQQMKPRWCEALKTPLPPKQITCATIGK